LSTELYKYKVRITCSLSNGVRFHDLTHDDQQVKPHMTGENGDGVHIYEVEAPNEVDCVQLALDKFHESIPIKCLDDFYVDYWVL